MITKNLRVARYNFILIVVIYCLNNIRNTIDNWNQLELLLGNLPTQGIHLWEVKTDRRLDSLWLKQTWNLAISHG